MIRSRIALAIGSAAVVTASLSAQFTAHSAAAAEPATVAVENALRTQFPKDAPPTDLDEVMAGTTAALQTSSGDLHLTSGTAATSRSTDSSVSYTREVIASDESRFAAVLASGASDTAAWTFEPGTKLLPLADGRVSVTNERGDFLAGIDAPWAIDAHGQELQTFYTVAGATLIQHIELTPSTTFPVVADPTVKTYIGYYEVRLNSKESATAVGTVAGCAALFSRAPYPASIAGVGCGVFAAYSTVQLAGGHCLVVHVVGIPPVMATWWPTFPKC